MNNIMKGRMEYDGVKIEFEGESSADIAKMVGEVLKSRNTTTVTTATPAVGSNTKRFGRPASTLTDAERREKKRIASLKWYYQNKDYYKNRRAKGVSVTTSTNSSKQTRHRSTYLEWTEADIVRVAAIVSLGGKTIKEVNDKVYQMLRNEGDVRNRTRENLYCFTQRLFRYVHMGKQYGIAQHTVKVLNQNGFHKGMKREEAPLMSGRLIPVEA